MRLRITNNSKAPFGVEKTGGGYAFIEPSEKRIVDARNPDLIYSHAFLEVESPDFHGGAIPEALASKVKAAEAAPVKPAHKPAPRTPRKRTTRRKKAVQ